MNETHWISTIYLLPYRTKCLHFVCCFSVGAAAAVVVVVAAHFVLFFFECGFWTLSQPLAARRMHDDDRQKCKAMRQLHAHALWCRRFCLARVAMQWAAVVVFRLLVQTVDRPCSESINVCVCPTLQTKVPEFMYRFDGKHSRHAVLSSLTACSAPASLSHSLTMLRIFDCLFHT